MRNQPIDAQPPLAVEDVVHTQWRRVVGRRSFLRGVGVAAAATVPGGTLFAGEASASNTITKGTSQFCGSWPPSS